MPQRRRYWERCVKTVALSIFGSEACNLRGHHGQPGSPARPPAAKLLRWRWNVGLRRCRSCLLSATAASSPIGCVDSARLLADLVGLRLSSVIDSSNMSNPHSSVLRVAYHDRILSLLNFSAVKMIWQRTVWASTQIIQGRFLVRLVDDAIIGSPA